VGILEQAGFAKLTPSFTEQVCALSGLDRADLFSNARGGMCRIVAAHPILGDLRVGDEISAPMLFGAIGPIRGTPLIAAPGMRNADIGEAREWSAFVAKQLNRPATQPSSAKSFEQGAVFCPLYISQLGKGR